MRGFFILLISIITLLNAAAQHEYDVWYFGTQAGIDFTSGTPVLLTNGEVSTIEGSAVISDSAGNLLFYTNGITVWNQNHVQMANGNNLHGGGSSTQSALILQLPGSDSLYYIFTIAQAAGADGLQYSIVDITLQGGLGEVIVKNVPLLSSTTEKMAAVRHINGTDIWVITHDMNNADFYAYQFSATGVNVTPVISNVGSIHYDFVGYMKASHAGTKLAVAVHYYFFELLSFDNTTGIVSNPIYMESPPTNFGPYGVEFSPNDSILYGTAYSVPCVILQWDISSGNDSIINASRIALDTSSAPNIGALQLASDGKIYMAKFGNDFLGVVNNPNVYGLGCNYDDHGFNLSPKLSQLGLPNIPDYWLGPQNSPLAFFVSTDSAGCGATCIDFTDQSVNNPTAWQWQFPGGTPSSSNNQHPSSICYNSTGSFDVTLITINPFGSDTLTLTNYITILAAPVAAISQSGNTLSTVTAPEYQWSYNGSPIPGATNQDLVITQNGQYVVTVTDLNGCSASDTLDVNSFPSNAWAASDTLLCQKFCINFSDLSANNPFSWLWAFPGATPSSSTNQNPTNICYDNPGTYDVTLITTNAFGTDTLTLFNFITVYATPPFPVITQGGDILMSSPATSYQWQFNSADIPGATNQFYTATETGYYTVVVSDVNGCKNSTTIYVEVTGVEELYPDFSFSIFPNPSDGNFTVELLNNWMGDAITIEIHNTLGQVIFSAEEKMNGNHFSKTIDAGEWAMGIYFLRISGRSSADKMNQEGIVRKLIITE